MRPCSDPEHTRSRSPAAQLPLTSHCRQCLMIDDLFRSSPVPRRAAVAARTDDGHRRLAPRLGVAIPRPPGTFGLGLILALCVPPLRISATRRARSFESMIACRTGGRGPTERALPKHGIEAMTPKLPNVTCACDDGSLVGEGRAFVMGLVRRDWGAPAQDGSVIHDGGLANRFRFVDLTALGSGLRRCKDDCPKPPRPDRTWPPSAHTYGAAFSSAWAAGPMRLDLRRQSDEP
jgi:hypothetical protein